MHDNILTWNTTNWITVFLMAVGGFFLLNLGVMGYKKIRSNSGGNTASSV